jgi:hypothetical protein
MKPNGHNEFQRLKKRKLCQLWNRSSTKLKAIPVTDRGGLWGCEMLRIPHCVENLFTNGGEVVSPTHPPLSTPQKHYFFASGTHFR